jgi:hypothetical protein
VALLRLQNGEVDVPGDGIPPAQVPGGDGRPAAGRACREGGQLHTGYVTLNVTTPPFDNVRCARPSTWRSTRTASPRSSTAARCRRPSRCRRRCRATPKDTRATPTTSEGRQGAAGRGGAGDGFETELYVMNTDPNPRIAQAIQQDLRPSASTPSIQKSLAQANVIEAGGAGTAPMIWSGGMAWIADFPDPSNFYGPILGCAGAVRGRLELVEVLQRGAGCQGGRGRQHVRPGQGGRPSGEVVRRLHGRDGAGALGRRSSTRSATR